MSKKAANPLPEKLEEALGELEKLVEKLETPDLPLEESIELFERGTQLSQVCYKKLEEAEKKVEVLLKKTPLPESRDDFDQGEFSA